MPDETFRKSDRILKRGTFRRVYDDGRKIQAKFFIGFILPNSERSARIGITVTRKTGKATRRNRCRRLIREVFRRNKWRVPEGIDIVVNAKSNLTEAGYQEVEEDFIRFLERCR